MRVLFDVALLAAHSFNVFPTITSRTGLKSLIGHFIIGLKKDIKEIIPTNISLHRQRTSFISLTEDREQI